MATGTSTSTSTAIPKAKLHNRKQQQHSQQSNGTAVHSDSPISSGSTTPTILPDAHAAPTTSTPTKELTIELLLAQAGAKPGSRDVDDWPLPDDIDLTRQASELLREGTAAAHVNAENSAGAVALTQGQLELQEYVRWLAILWRVYDALETGLNAHATNSVLNPTYNPVLLARAPELAKDIEYLLPRLPPSPATQVSSTANIASNATPLPPFPVPPFMQDVFTDKFAPLNLYIERLNELSRSAETAPRLLAHAYVRYLGDLSGGQIIGNKLRKAYNLPTLDGRRFYFFDLEGNTSEAEAGEETVGERKKKLNAVKGWYREGMDVGAGSDSALKASLVKEAILAFMFNTHIFTLIPEPKPKKELRYYEKMELERQRQLALNPPKKLTWGEQAIRFCWFVAAALFGLFLANFVAPRAAVIAEPYYVEYIAPIVDSKIMPIVDGTILPYWNDKVVPWWVKYGEPTLSRQLTAQRRRLF